jgi:hypothetical protein
MKLNQFNKFKKNFEVFYFENSFSSLNKTLYYFSFLGNIMVIFLSYFYLVEIAGNIPQTFEYQGLAISLFSIVFMTGYELFKRFSIEQLISLLMKDKKISMGWVANAFLTLLLVVGSFFLAIKGSQRLIYPTSEKQIEYIDRSIQASDSVLTYYNTQIQLLDENYNSEYGSMKDRYESTNGINSYESKLLKEKRDAYYEEKEQLINFRDIESTKIKDKYTSQNNQNLESNQENLDVFGYLAFFLEFIVIIGVGFSTFYQWKSYGNMKEILSTPAYRQIQIHLDLLDIFYQKGRKMPQDRTMSVNKLKDLVSSSNIQIRDKEIKSFISMCEEKGIISSVSRNMKVYTVDYQSAKEILESQDF